MTDALPEGVTLKHHWDTLHSRDDLEFRCHKCGALGYRKEADCEYKDEHDG